MIVKELIERLKLLDSNLEVYIWNEKEHSLFLVRDVCKTSDFGWNEEWEDFVTIFPANDSQPLFTLTAEEVANLFEVLSTRNNLIDEVLRTTFIEDPYTRELVDEQKKIIPILNQIKQWQDGNK